MANRQSINIERPAARQQHSDLQGYLTDEELPHVVLVIAANLFPPKPSLGLQSHRPSCELKELLVGVPPVLRHKWVSWVSYKEESKHLDAHF